MGETWARHGRDHCANAQIWRSGRLRRCKYMQGMVVTPTDHCAKRSLKFGAVVGVGAVVVGQEKSIGNLGGRESPHLWDWRRGVLDWSPHPDPSPPEERGVFVP